MEYKMIELNGIYKARNNFNTYVVLFENGISRDCISIFQDQYNKYYKSSGFTDEWGKYTDAEPHEIASLEQSIIAKSLVIVEKKKEELSHIPLMF